MDEVLILKVKDEGSDYQGAWKIRPERLRNIDHVVVLKDKTVVAEFSLGPVFKFDRLNGRVFDLELKNYTGANKLLSMKLDYNTSNPATIKKMSDLLELSI